MPDRLLSSDALGKKGERRFGELCDDANLIANGSDYDRAGWDFVVDFRLPTDGRALDARPAPISARVQVKTQWDDQSTIKMRLTSAEQLIKYNGPSFVCVLSVNEALEFTSMRLIHCRGPVVAKVLERLRRAEADGARPNQIDFYLRPQDFSEELAPHHGALRSALEAVCTTDHLAYLTAKDKELRTLGFDGGFMDLKATFVGNEDDIQDAFLGLRPIEGKTVSATQKRFGISLPFEGMPISEGTFSFEPKGEKCRVWIKWPDGEYAFKALLIRPPSLVAASVAKPKFLIRSELFQITIVQTRTPTANTITYNFEILEQATTSKHKPAAWAELYEVFAAVARGAVELSMQPLGEKRLRFGMSLDTPKGSHGRWQYMARLSRTAARIFDEAGAPNAKVGMQEMLVSRTELETAEGLIRAPGALTRLSFATDAEIALPIGESIDTLLGHAFSVGEHVIACGIRTRIFGTRSETGDADWGSEAAVADGMRRVKSIAGFHKFVRGRKPASCTLLSGVYNKGMDIYYSPPGAE